MLDSILDSMPGLLILGDCGFSIFFRCKFTDSHESKGRGGGGGVSLPKINNYVKKKTVEISEKWCWEGTHVERSLSRVDEECVVF